MMYNMFKNHKVITLQSTILNLYSLYVHEPLPYILSLIICYLPYPIISTIISTLPLLISHSPLSIKIIITMTLLLIPFIMRHNHPQEYWIQAKHLLPLYLIAFSMVSVTHVWPIRTIGIIWLLVVVLLSINYSRKLFIFTIQLLNILTMLWGIYSFTELFCGRDIFPYKLDVQADTQWYYGCMWVTVLLGRMLTQFLPQPQPQPKEIQMKDLSQSIEESQQKLQQKVQEKVQQKTQADILNVFLLLPFTLFQAEVVQLPIYIYIIPLQYNYAPTWSFYLMLLSVFGIIYLSEEMEIVLRVAMVLIINKNIQLAISITKLVRSIVLRGSFMVVLSVLLWFALKTVNVFHIGLVVVLLLFITKNAKSDTNERSFRNRKWKYLQGIFQIFMVCRYMWSVWKQFSLPQPMAMNNILSLLGINHEYTESIGSFNTIPFLISGVIGVQYWIYRSHIYNLQSKKELQILPAYRIIIEKLITTLTICYYKIIPWSSHMIVLIILLSLQFSMTAGIIVLWTMVILLTHMLNSNSPSTYEKMYSRWLICSRLIAIQIVLRYLFEFMKFPILYQILADWPIMSNLLRYEQILGLVIRQSENGYWKNLFTKFQIMIAIDFILIAISFLSLEYYRILIKYAKINQLSSQEEKTLISQTYEKYIDFKLTEWLINFNQLLRVFSIIFLKLYYPLIAIYSCLYYSYANLIYISLCTIYYLSINQHLYRTYVLDRIQATIAEILQKWRSLYQEQQVLKDQSSSQSENTTKSNTSLHEQIRYTQHKLKNHIPYTLTTDQLQTHEKLRLFVVFFTLLFVILNYASRVLESAQINNFLEPEEIRYYRWLLLLVGTSYQSNIQIAIYLMIVMLTVVEIKCCSLLGKQPHQKEEEMEELLLEIEGSKFVDMEVSLWLGINKLMERTFVILLVFVSLLEDNNPFSIVYLSCAWLLNYMGSTSIQNLSRVLAIIVLLEYSLVVTNTAIDPYFSEKFPQYVEDSWLVRVFGIEQQQWRAYLCFGDSGYEKMVILLTMMILMTYQICFMIEKRNWLWVLKKLVLGMRLDQLSSKIYQYLTRIYDYALMYSPICITTLCLALYLMDYTATNMFLAILSVLFLFKSFLLQNYTSSRQFWKSYFRILQLLIIFFMVVYCVLTTPMYSKYCNKLLCSSQQFSTKVTKTILLLILQIGIDLISSRHFVSAMITLKTSLQSTSLYYRLGISYVQNDRKIGRKFRLMNRKSKLKQNTDNVISFIQELQTNPAAQFHNKSTLQTQKQSWLDTVLQLLPSLVDDQLIKSPQQCEEYVKSQNSIFINWLQMNKEGRISEDEIRHINEIYLNTFQQTNNQQLINKINEIRREKKLKKYNTVEIEEYRKSYMEDELPFEHNFQSERLNSSRRTVVEELLNKGDPEGKKKLLYLLIFESIVSNWHFLTYILMIMEFIFNMGILTVVYPLIVFLYGLTYTYQAPKWVWRLAFIFILFPLSFKFAISIGLLAVEPSLQFLLIGNNIDSILLEYCLIFFILIQCLILKIVGLYDYSTPQIECMRMALIRNIVNLNSDRQREQRQQLFMLLDECDELSSTYWECMFSRKECKSGYDYSTVMVSVQLMILVYIFCFYDRMAIKNELTFYQMIQYNQFTTGMVIMAFIQLLFILVDRALNVVEFSERKWDLTLIIKYFSLLIFLIYIHLITILFFPFNSGNFTSNNYITVFYLLHAVYFLISALQIRLGIEKESRGFMDRYTWYNGFVYMAYRAIPFLFQFKVFSDWTFTNTSLRLFDWIKFEQIFGRLYVAKCNSLFLQGKMLGSKIQWWKKLLMGFPLLLSIILLLFGPLILFSNLNPLSAVNEVSGGYLELLLRVNKTNNYLFYTNSHITDIHFMGDNVTPQLIRLIKDYQLDPASIQEVYLEDFSDKYWQISAGSFNRLMAQPQTSLYELTMKIKFQRNLTGSTPVYELNSYTIPQPQIAAFKKTLLGEYTFTMENFFPSFVRLDNNNGLHFLGQEKLSIKFHAVEGERTQKKYWVINNGIQFRLVSDRYSKAIFGYSVMSFYISIILVVANYFRFLFQGSAHTIIMSDIPYADPMLMLCNAVHQARMKNDLKQEEILFWTLIDVVRSPDTIKALTGNYLEARKQTLRLKEE